MEETTTTKHKSSSRDRDDDDATDGKDRDRHRHRDHHRRHRSDRERSTEEKIRRSDRERSTTEEKIRRSEREHSSDDKHHKHRDRKEKERAKEKAREEKEREREKAERRLEERAREREERERAREEREREKAREREEKEREREVRKREEREREKERAREREEKEREREARKREEREREKEREREEREKERDRERKRREAEREEDVREHDRKRRRREGSREHSSRSDHHHRHHREDDDDGRRKEEEREKKKKTREEDLQEEQQKLDEEMDKRRRRVQEWQELRRKEEEQEREKVGGEEQPKSGKNWTLDGESDDDEAVPTKSDKDIDVDDNDFKPNGDAMSVDAENGDGDPKGANAEEEEEIDPLDAFMDSILPTVEKLTTTTETAVQSVENKVDSVKKVPEKALSNGKGKKNKRLKNAVGRILPGEDSDSDYGDLDNDEAPQEDEDDEEFIKRVKKTKAEKLSVVDHSKIEYPPFRKNFYIEVKEISRMSPQDAAAYRLQLELKVRGKDVPKPVKTWNQTGLTNKILDTLKKLGFEKPMSIQAQALPVIMSGRDCIGIAKTGSGKTLAFVLPMLRHIKDQPLVVPGDGPIGLIMAPTRELVQQIHSDIKKFTKVMGINCVPVYGGSGVAQQISDLKRGAEIVVCTPGRMIDILCTSSGKITNLRRVTYLVMDEADRMFDMGFEPQITRIVQNTQPDRQTVLFSATFPHQVEILARKVLNKPVEIQVGGKSVVNKDISQLVEVRPESDRFFRLLELLGEWYEKGKILVFVHSQDKCDSLFKDLIKHGYPCLSLHGAKDQTDRESTLADFKSNVCNLMIATSIAARGLDVKDLELVVNFDVPNHYEDYVHRVGRTGRAGKKGCAVTFISEDEARYAPDLVKALELSEQAIPADLKAICDGFMAKVNHGTEQVHGTGYGGSGFKFNEEEDEARKAAKKAQAREYGFEEDKSDSDSEDDGVRKAGGDLAQATAMAQAAAIAAATRAPITTTPLPVTPAQLLTTGGLPAVTLPGAVGLPVPGALPLTAMPGDAAARAAALAAAMNLQHNLAKIQADALPEHYEAELEINDFPQNARWKVTHKETLGPISEWTGAAITTRGQYYPPGKLLGPGERKLYLFIEGPTESSVKKAKAEVKRVLEDYTSQSLSLPGAAGTGKYSVL